MWLLIKLAWAMQYIRSSMACPYGNPLFELAEPRLFLDVELFIADSDKMPEPWEGGPKKRLGLLAVCAVVTQMQRDFQNRAQNKQEGEANCPVCL